MTITFTPNIGYAQFSVDHPPGVDWINYRNQDAVKNDALFGVLKVDTVSTRLGIGVTPVVPLHVFGQASNEMARFQSRTDASNNRAFLSLYTTNPGYWWELSNQDSTGGGTSNNLAFRERTATDPSVVRLYLETGGNVGIGTSTPASKLGVLTGTNGGVNVTDGIVTGVFYASSGPQVTVGTTSNHALSLFTNNAERMKIAAAGNTYFPGVGTTASAANAFLNSGSAPANELLRSTSSRKYKTDIHDLADWSALAKLRPITYRSLAEADDKDRQWLGLIAEEVAEVEPRLVHYVDSKPDGVQYDRIVVLLITAIQQLAARLTVLEGMRG